MNPISVHEETVQKEWIDYNGHMNVAFYVLVFDHATDGLFDKIELGEVYRQATDHSFFVVESHVTYDHEVVLGDPLLIKTWLLGADGKRLHIFHEMYHKETKIRCATNEIMALHIDIKRRKTANFSEKSQFFLKGKVQAVPWANSAQKLGRSIQKISE